MRLPDCRAYEQVTPAEKDSDEPEGIPAGLEETSLDSKAGIHASITGDRMAWDSEYVFPRSASPGLDYLSTRGADGWESKNVIPPQSVENGVGCPLLVGIAAYSYDLSEAVLADGFAQHGSFHEESLDCGHDEPLLTEGEGEPRGFQNLFLGSSETGSYRLINVTPANAPAPAPAPENHGQYFPASFLAGSNNLSHVIFEEELPLTAGAPSGDDIYLWPGSHVEPLLVTILPDGKVASGTLAGATRNTTREESIQEFVPYNIANFRHVVSGDGSRILFQAEGNLYVRESGTDTVQVDESHGPGASGGGKFMVASEDGSKVFFTDENALTDDSAAEPGDPDLYEYEVNSEVGKPGNLIDLTPIGGAKVLGVSGASNDGSYVYFVAEGELASGAPGGAHATDPTAGQPNLYVFHAGATRFIATLDPQNDVCDWMSPACVNYPLLGGLTARASASGSFVGFDSDLSLTGYHNAGADCVPILSGGSGSQVEGFSPGECQEVFLYSASANTLSCASCDPSGQAPVGPAVIRFPAKASTDGNMRNAYPQRNVSNQGEVFFETADPLVPTATNGRLDVYEYKDGQPYLLSSGTSEADSYFLDASVDGSNVFFATAQSLLEQNDTDAAYDIYDARVDGGFVEPTNPTLPCEGEEGCLAPAGVAPSISTPSTATFVDSATTPSVTLAFKKKVAKTKGIKKKKPVKKKRKKKGRKTGSRFEPTSHSHPGGAQ